MKIKVLRFKDLRFLKVITAKPLPSHFPSKALRLIFFEIFRFGDFRNLRFSDLKMSRLQNFKIKSLRNLEYSPD